MNPANLVGAIAFLNKNKDLRTICISLALGYLAHRYLEKKAKKKSKEHESIIKTH